MSVLYLASLALSAVALNHTKVSVNSIRQPGVFLSSVYSICDYKD